MSEPTNEHGDGVSSEETTDPRVMMRLDDVLKRAGWVGTGGQAKIWIQDGQVSVNGEVETRRRKQIFLGDIVESMGQQVTLDETFFDC